MMCLFFKLSSWKDAAVVCSLLYFLFLQCVDRWVVSCSSLNDQLCIPLETSLSHHVVSYLLLCLIGSKFVENAYVCVLEGCWSVVAVSLAIFNVKVMLVS